MGLSDDREFGVLLVEHGEEEDDSLPVWSFPAASAQIQQLVCVRCFSTRSEAPFIYFKYKNEWVYCLTMPTVFPNITSASCCVLAKSFNPEKWNAVLQVLFEQYGSSSNADPTKILEGYLSLVTTGHFSNAAGTVALSSFPDADVCNQCNVVKDLVAMLGIETVILWNAVLLKRRVLVVSETVDKLFPVLRSLPLLAAHRKDFAQLRPIVSADQEINIEDLSSAGVWIAGTTDAALAAQETLYDVVLNLSERRVAVAAHAISDLKMCATHREVAVLMTNEAASPDSTSLGICSALANKTNQVLATLRGLAGPDGKLTEQLVVASGANDATQQWLVRLAGAEGLL